MTKKFFFSFCLITIFSSAVLFFSCASTPSQSEIAENDLQAPDFSQTEKDSVSETEDNQIENTEQDSTDEKTDTTSNLTNDVENKIENNSPDNETDIGEKSEETEKSLQDVPEIEEPLVRDLEIPEEKTETSVEENETEPVETSEEEEYLKNALETEDSALGNDENKINPENNQDEISASVSANQDNTDQSDKNSETIIDEKNNKKENSPNYEDDVVSLDENEDNKTSVHFSEKENDVLDEDNSESEENTLNSIQAEEIKPSRSISLKRNEYLDVVYPGSGWIFMGTTDGSKAVASYGRKLGTKNTTFTLLAKEAGTYMLHFYKQDNLTGNYIDDYLEVVISSDKTTSKEHKTAPEYKEIVPKKAEIKTSAENQKTVQPEKNTESEVKTAAQPSENITAKTKNESAIEKQSEEIQSKSENTKMEVSPAENIDCDTLLKEAKILYDEKEYEKALSKLNQFFTYATAKLDQGYYLKGQVLEADSSVKNIKEAINAYSTLTKNYPVSTYWDDANKRIIYLKRFYLEAR